jgi:hypothetical protein
MPVAFGARDRDEGPADFRASFPGQSVKRRRCRAGDQVLIGDTELVPVPALTDVALSGSQHVDDNELLGHARVELRYRQPNGLVGRAGQGVVDESLDQGHRFMSCYFDTTRKRRNRLGIGRPSPVGILWWERRWSSERMYARNSSEEPHHEIMV